ncbi:methyltransferase domain-containing protein [Sulfurospirillum oryzae]|uniref:methyltransferase domain-containing protein n=1 Tax=Sulfurospirillum oryzae TaxID=2976535 RepID=UPI0021E8E25E|nr:methyltransferase domain-containing protein [Sulfurospirillum oryzae]
MNNNYYEQEELWNRDLTSQETERIDIVKKFIPNDVKTVLDAGCGNGAISNYLDGFDITAIDRSHEALKYVKNKSVEGSLDSLPFEDDSFDLIICSDVLEHLTDEIYKKTIKEFKRVSKKYILIISPNDEDLEANQSKCSKCGTVFHMNWHISSISLNKIMNDFRDDYTPVYYSFFGNKWVSEPEIKYTLARTTNRGYKKWENAVCPMCNTKQRNSQENTKDIDIECNRFLNGFYNYSTEFIVLLSTMENKKEIFDFDNIEENTLLSQKEICQLHFVNRQSILSKYDIFTKKHTEFYPQYAYILDENFTNEPNRRLICFPYLIKDSQKIYFAFQDNLNAKISVNIYDLEKYFINIGTIELSNDHNKKIQFFEISNDLIPANEGLIFELITDNIHAFENFVFDKIYIDENFGDLVLSKEKNTEFFTSQYLTYTYDYRKKDSSFLVLDKDVLVYDGKNRCFFMNLSDSFEFFCVSKNTREELETIKEELVKQRNTSREELETIKEELVKQRNTLKQDLNHEIEALHEQLKKINQEMYQLKVGVYTISNSHESFVKRVKSPLRYLFGRLKNKFLPTTNIKKSNKDKSKHLVVITPDVKIDRRTVQMCQSLIKTYGIRCTIIAALEGKDDFVTDKLKVKRIDPYKTEKYILKPDDWTDGTTLNLKDFYWLHLHYLNMALNEEADYIMCCDLPVLPAAVYASKIKNVPLIYDAHELYPEQAIFSEKKRESYTQVESHFIKYPHLVITVNESIAIEMRKRYGINKPEVILNALDASSTFDKNKKYDYFREKLPIRKEQKIVLFQGGYSPNRNLELFVKSAKYIKDNSIVLVLMGFGNFEQVLENIAKEDKTINEKVFFFPAVDQSVLLEYSASADVGIIPYPHIDLNSFYCTPNKLFEFIQAGLPIIANDSPELNKFVQTYNIGHSYKINDEKDIARMIDSYFEENKDYKQNLLTARNEICWTTEEKKFIALFKEIL